MKTQNVYELLKKLNKATPRVKEAGNRLLKFIYSDVYSWIADRCKSITVEYPEGSIGYEREAKPFKLLKNSLEEYLDGNNSIITYFDEMVNDNKTEFIDAFLEKVNVFLDISENHYYEESDFISLSFTFNIYPMLKGYHEHKDDFDTFKTILDDCSFLINCKDFSRGSTYSIEKLSGKKTYIDKLLETRFYSEFTDISSYLKSTLERITYSSGFDKEELEEKIKSIDSVGIIYNDLEELKKEDSNYNIIAFDEIARSIFNNALSYRSKKIFYCKSLLIGERFNYINNSLNNHITIECIRNDVFNKIKSLNYKMFDYLNSTISTENDSFIEIMKVVFDSDTFYEVEEKLKALSEASYEYGKGNKGAVLSVYNNLNDSKYKKVFDDKVFVFDIDSLNKTRKPASIIDRTYEIYSKMYPKLNIRNCIKNASNDCSYLSNFNVRFDHYVLTEISRVKQIEDEQRKKEEANRLAREEEQARNEAMRKALEEASDVVGIAEEEKTIPTNVDIPIVNDVSTDVLSDDQNSTDEPKGFFKIKSIFGKKS